jgi:hypothetical protein
MGNLLEVLFLIYHKSRAWRIGSDLFPANFDDPFLMIEDDVELELKLFVHVYAAAHKLLLEHPKRKLIRNFCLCLTASTAARTMTLTMTAGRI